MPETLADQGSPAPETPASETPAPVASPDIEKLRADLSAEFEKKMQDRVTGFQRLLSEREQELRELKTAGLSEEEREQLARQESEDRVAALERENELLKLSRVYPEEAPLFEQLLAAPTAKDQLEFLRKLKADLKAASTPAAPANEAEEPDIPDVISTNPMRPPEQGVLLPNGTLMTEDLADRLLGAAGKGALRGR